MSASLRDGGATKSQVVVDENDLVGLEKLEEGTWAEVGRVGMGGVTMGLEQELPPAPGETTNGGPDGREEFHAKMRERSNSGV